MKKVLVVGANGMLGVELLQILEKQFQCLGRDIADFDITDCDCTIQAIRKINPQVVINVAAFTFVDLCEQEKERAFAVNGEGPGMSGGGSEVYLSQHGLCF